MALPFLIPPLIQFGANLLTTAADNYGDYHKQNMENLLVSLQQPTNPTIQQGIMTNPYGQTGGYQQPGYPNQDYPTVQDYPPSQGYPSSEDYSQQAYDPYQNQQPQYGGNAPYPDNQYPNQGQQGNPYSNNPVYPNQQASVPGYSSYPQNQYPQQGQQANAYPNIQNAYPHQQNPYPNQEPYPNQPLYPKGQPYPDTSYPSNQQGQAYPTPYGNTGTAPTPAYPNQNPYPRQAHRIRIPPRTHRTSKGNPLQTPYGNAGMASTPAYPNQPQGATDYQTAQTATGQAVTAADQPGCAAGEKTFGEWRAVLPADQGRGHSSGWERESTGR